MQGDFIDTNVLIYLAQGDRDRAERVRLLLQGKVIVSVQVLNEIATVLRRKSQMPWVEVREFLSLLNGLCEIIPVDHDVHEIGLNIAERYGFAIYDSMIIAAALKSGCAQVFSEDMQHGQVIDGLITVVNPFR